jgi:hypothetical protein
LGPLQQSRRISYARCQLKLWQIALPARRTDAGWGAQITYLTGPDASSAWYDGLTEAARAQGINPVGRKPSAAR